MPCAVDTCRCEGEKRDTQAYHPNPPAPDANDIWLHPHSHTMECHWALGGAVKLQGDPSPALECIAPCRPPAPLSCICLPCRPGIGLRHGSLDCLSGATCSSPWGRRHARRTLLPRTYPMHQMTDVKPRLQWLNCLGAKTEHHYTGYVHQNILLASRQGAVSSLLSRSERTHSISLRIMYRLSGK